MPVDPTCVHRRSPIEATLHAAGGSEVAIGDGVRANSLPLPLNGACGFADLTTFPRTGFAGARCAAWLAAKGLTVPADTGRVAPDSGRLVARLAPDEVLVLDDETGVASSAALNAAARDEAPPHCYPLPWGDSVACFAISGLQAGATLGRLVELDLRTQVFADLTVARTLVAGVPGVLLRADRAGRRTYYVLPQSASARYVWHCLARIGEELGLVPAGAAGLRSG